jgi:transcriptional regulator with XRE-family HTH domain
MVSCVTQPVTLFFTTRKFLYLSMETTTKPRHLGKKIGRIREMLGVKQETLAEKLGISQQAVSKLEQSEEVDDAQLERVGVALGVGAEAIKNFSEESIIYNIQNNYEGSNLSMSPNYQYNNQCTFNPIDKWLEAIEENKKLYEALLKAEREKVALLEKMVSK